MALIDKLRAIGDGFRSSRGTEQEFTLDEMAAMASEPVGVCEMISVEIDAYSSSGVCYFDSSGVIHEASPGTTIETLHGLILHDRGLGSFEGVGDFTEAAAGSIMLLKFNSDGGRACYSLGNGGGSSD